MTRSKSDPPYSIPRRFPGGTVFILAGGPSLAGQNVDRLEGRPTIAINLSYPLAPWATYVYAMDARFLRRHRPNLEAKFKDRVLTVSRSVLWPGLLRCKKKDPPGLASKPTELVGKRTSLAGAINAAAHLTGAGGTVVLLGADGGPDASGRRHHHQAHPWVSRPDVYEAQAKELAELMPDLEAMAISVVNCSPGSHWDFLWPIMSLDEFFEKQSQGEVMPETGAARRRFSYDRVFMAEQKRGYPSIDAIEARLRYDLARPRLETMARELACPVKANPPNWQHGRVIYALTRNWLDANYKRELVPFFLDIGTAKGFSALCFAWALYDHQINGKVLSVDVLDPAAKVERNTVAEVDGFKTLYEIVQPHRPRERDDLPIVIDFQQRAGMDCFDLCAARIAGAFVDGKHKLTDVYAEATGIAARQFFGDFILFDDAQIGPVAMAIEKFSKESGHYFLEEIPVHNDRRYVLARRAR